MYNKQSQQLQSLTNDLNLKKYKNITSTQTNTHMTIHDLCAKIIKYKHVRKYILLSMTSNKKFVVINIESLEQKLAIASLILYFDHIFS